MLKLLTGISMSVHKRTKKILWTFTLAFISVVSYSQQSNNSIKVNYKNASLKDVCTDIEQKSTFRFSYSEKNLKLYDKKITLKSDDLSVKQVLEEVFNNTPLQYIIKENIIVLSADPSFGKNTMGILKGKIS